MEHKVGIVGCGFVGTAVSTGLQVVAEIREHDKYKDTESLHSVVTNSDFIFLCLPTPMNEDGSCDTSIIEDVAGKITDIADKRKIIVIKSTVPPWTTENLSTLYPDHSWFFNPEFLTEARFIEDFLEQDRIFLGYCENSSENDIHNLYMLYFDFTNLVQKDMANIIEIPSHEAEMLKNMTNTFLSTKVTFFNEMKEICNGLEIDFDHVRKELLRDKRIGQTHTAVPGPDGKHGFGGSCFPKDLNAIIAHSRDFGGIDPILLDTVWTKNLMIREEHEWEDLAQVTGEYDQEV